jgi:2,3-dihydroxybenzoate-AMP ligase
MHSKVPPWPEDFAQRYRDLGYWEGKTFSEKLRELVDRFGDRTAVVDGDVRLSYRELQDRAILLAQGLRRNGIGRGNAVLLQLPNCAEFVVAWFALQQVGAVPVHTQPGHRFAEVDHLAGATDAVAYITADIIARFDHLDLARRVADNNHALATVIVVGALDQYADDRRFVTYTEVAGGSDGVGDPRTSEVSPSDLAMLLLSGGTTGMPKLIGRTHDDYLYNSRAAGERSRLDSNSVYLAVLPIAFNYTWNCPGILGTLTVGGKVVMSRNPDPSVCFELIEAEGVTMTAINPQLAPVWLSENSRTTRDLSSLKILEIGSARLADHVAREIVDQFDCTLQQILGMSEGLFCATHLDDDAETRCTTQGVPVSPADEIRVVDAEGNEVADGEIGELTIRGPYTPRGYFDAPEHNRKSFSHDGFYLTGDLVRRLPTGHLIVSGRIKDQINRGGEKIAATEVEGFLLAHPDIETVAVVGESHASLGERSVAFVVPSGADAPSRRDLARFLADAGLAAYKAPDVVRIIETMPLTPLGKIDKNVLRLELDSVL